MSRIKAVGAAVALLVAVSPAQALPDTGPPQVSIAATPTADPFTYRLEAHASDPDGRIRELRICVAEGFDVVCTAMPTTQPDTVADLQACLDGDSANYHRDKTFVGYGVYSVTAVATGGGCPVVGGDQQESARTTVIIAPPPEPIPCADSDVPVASDTGVTADRISLGATVALDLRNPQGPGAMRGILAAVERVNGTGGVCGRMLDLQTVDDGGDAQYGLQFIRNFIAEDTFALVGMPSAEGLRAAILAGDIDAEGIPVVGTQGQTEAEFSNPWVFPVAPSSRAFGHISLRHAVEENKAHVAIVYSTADTSSIEARAGVHEALAANPGMTLDFEARVQPGQTTYAAEVNQYRAACHDLCDALILAMDPLTTFRWLDSARAQGAPPASTSLMPRSTNHSLASGCGSACTDVIAWTGFRPPAIGGGVNTARYAADLAAIDETTDPNEAFAEGAYVGTIALARAIGLAGTNLTRAGLRTVLETQSIDIGLTRDPLVWPADRNANPALRGLAMSYSGGLFTGWANAADWTTP